MEDMKDPNEPQPQGDGDPGTKEPVNEPAGDDTPTKETIADA